MIGKTLAQYEVREPLGAGGMGEVYRARDTKLDRDVAIKVLPADFARDADRLARFEREAKLLAQLNHSNIAGIFGLEESEGVRFIAMELVEGATLADRIVRSGGLEVDEALAIARQIAEALEAAHDNGVIHRDLKPANVKVTPDGTVKVLDFGLAKAQEGSLSTSSGDLSDSPTLAGQTTAGMIVGTAAYMSPEQARGQETDARADIWAFGALLFEMLSGRRAFEGDTKTDLLAAVVKEEPAWDSLPEETPEPVRALLLRCLRKDPKNRVHHIADARIEISEAIHARTPERPEPMAASGSVGTWRWVSLAAVVLLAVLAVVALWPSTPEEPLVYLMDTAAPLGVYDAETRSRGGTNADDLSDLLGDLPVRTAREPVNPLWHREHEVLSQRPVLIVVHRSAFAHQPGIADSAQANASLGDLEELGLENPYELGWSKLIGFLGYIGLGNPETRFLIYSRGFPEQEAWIDGVVSRFPQLEGKVTTYSVPRDEQGNASFRDPETGAEVKELVVAILGLE